MGFAGTTRPYFRGTNDFTLPFSKNLVVPMNCSFYSSVSDPLSTQDPQCRIHARWKLDRLTCDDTCISFQSDIDSHVSFPSYTDLHVMIHISMSPWKHSCIRENPRHMRLCVRVFIVKWDMCKMRLCQMRPRSLSSKTCVKRDPLCQSRPCQMRPASESFLCYGRFSLSHTNTMYKQATLCQSRHWAMRPVT